VKAVAVKATASHRVLKTHLKKLPNLSNYKITFSVCSQKLPIQFCKRKEKKRKEKKRKEKKRKEKERKEKKRKEKKRKEKKRKEKKRKEKKRKLRGMKTICALWSQKASPQSLTFPLKE
jgi:hypothetical protein